MDTVGHNKISINIVWTLITGFLVMFMQAGFAMVETGFTRAKNAAHTMSMNFMVYPIGMLGYWICGFALQMGGVGAVAALGGTAPLSQRVRRSTSSASRSACSAPRASSWARDVYDVGVFALFLFQMVFMDTTVTIPTGAMAERWKWSSFLVYGFFMSMFVYPLFANWVWGGGWLSQLGANFGLGHGHVDFAGSSVVHMVGGVAALAGAIVLGPAHRQVHARTASRGDPRPSHPDGHRGHASSSPSAGSASTPARPWPAPTCASRVVATNTMLAVGRRGARRDDLHDDEVREARPQHDGERHAGRPRGHHRSLRVRHRARVRC